jgi:hypothetical protein
MYLLLFFIFGLLNSNASSKIQNSAFQLNWMKFPEKREGALKFQMIKRIMPIAGDYVSLGDITMVEMPKEKGFIREHFIRDYSYAMGIRDWNTRQVDNVFVYEQEWTEARKFIRIFLEEKQESVKFSIAILRKAYIRELYLESEIIQRLQFTKNRSGMDWAKEIVSFVYNNLSISSASAQFDWANLFNGGGPGGGTSGIPGNNGIGPLPGGLDPNSISNLVNNINGLNSTMNQSISVLNETNVQLGNANSNWTNSNVHFGNMNQNWQNTNGQIGVANQNWADTNKQLAGANQNWAESNNQMNIANQNWAETNQQLKEYQKLIGGLGKDFLSQANETSKMIDTNWKETNRIADGYLNVMKDMTNPKKVAILAGATAAGAALGATAVNLAVGGVKWGIGILAKFISGEFKEKKHQELLNEFKTAREAYYKTKSQVQSLEEGIDSFIKLFEMANLDQIPVDKVFSELTSIRILKNSELSYKNQKLDQMTVDVMEGRKDDNSCRENLAKEIQELKTFIGTTEKIVDLLKKTQQSDQICANLKQALAQIIDMEHMLDLHRRELIHATSAYVEEINRRQKEVIKLNDKLNDGDDDRAVDGKIKKAQKISELTAHKNIKMAKSSYKDACHELMRSPLARKGLVGRNKFCRQTLQSINSLIQEDLTKRSNKDILNSNESNYFKMVEAKIEDRVRKYFPAVSNRDYESFYRDAVKKLRGPLVQYTQEQFNSAKADDVFQDLKDETKIQKKTDKDDFYTTNNWLFAETIKSAEEFRKDLEEEVTGLSEIHNDDAEGKNYELTKVKNMRLEKLLAKKRRLEELCN